MGAFLCWLGVRLLEMHRVLAEDGSLYLHMDDTASAWVKWSAGTPSLAGIISGTKSSGNVPPAAATPSHLPRVHDSLLYYVKSAAAEWNQQYEPLSEEYIAQNYRYEDDVGRYTTMPLMGRGRVRPNPRIYLAGCLCPQLAVYRNQPGATRGAGFNPLVGQRAAPAASSTSPNRGESPPGMS